MTAVNTMKGLLLKSSFIKKLNNNLKVRRFYSQGKKVNGSSESVLFWTTGGMIVQTNLEGVLAAALKLRGHRVRVILCDGVYTACAKRVDMPDVQIDDWSKFCRSCIRQNTKVLEKLGIDVAYISELVDESRALELRTAANEISFDDYRDLSLNGMHLGSHLESAMMRHTRGGSYTGLERILREYAFTILINAEASENARKRFNPTRVYMSHGIYADWGPALSVFLKNNIPISSYICCYLTAHFFFGTVKSYEETFLTISNDYWNSVRDIELTESQKNRLETFLSRRYLNNVTQDLKGLLKDYRGDTDYFNEKYDLDPDKPVWGIMTHINWDAASDYFPMVHKSFDEWLYETVREIYNVTDVQWLIKIHPSELNDNPETGCQKFIEKNFPDLPLHIKVLKMDDEISPLDFYHLLDGAVTVMGTGGLELSLKGKPVILAGEAHYSKKGFTFDAKDNEHYKKLLRQAGKIGALDEVKTALAWRYAYIYFIRKQIPLLPTIREDLQIDFDLIDKLVPGKNPYMDFLCDRIIDGKDFIMPEKLVEPEITEKDQIRNYA